MKSFESRLTIFLSYSFIQRARTRARSFQCLYTKEASGKNITVTVHVGFCSYQLSESNENSFMLSEAITDTDKVISSPQT